MNKRIKITPDIIAYLRCKKVPEMWNPNYSKCYAKIDNDLLVNLGGQGYMNEKNMPTSNIEEYWGGVIDDIPFVVALYFYDKEVSENHFIRYMSISEFRIRTEKVDEMKFLKRFQELILDYGLYMIKRELDDCYIVGIPKFKYVINL